MRFSEVFVQRSWNARSKDLDLARDAGAEDADIVDWALMAFSQAIFALMADASGIEVPFGETGPVLGRKREIYQAAADGATAPESRTAGIADERNRTDATCWVETDPSAGDFRELAVRAEARWGLTPNVLRAVSRGRTPGLAPLVLMALELLEGPQSELLGPGLHAMVRATAAAQTRSSYSHASIRQQLCSNGIDPSWLETPAEAALHGGKAESVVHLFAAKAARNAYKITQRDVDGFRDAGLGDEAYVDVFCTVALQMNVDRVANCLGVVPDHEPLLRQGCAST